MARRRTEHSADGSVENKVNETLSQETPEVQEKVLEDLLGNQVKEVFVEEPVPVEPVEEDVLKSGDRVKIKPGVGSDIVGRRIHNGIKNYLYTVKNVRDDGYVNIECLTYVFTLHKKDLDIIKRG